MKSMPEVLENSIAFLQAQAAIELFNKEKQAAGGATTSSADCRRPTCTMQQQELELAVDDQQRLVTKDAGELALKQRRLALDEEKAKVDAVLEAQRIAPRMNKHRQKMIWKRLKPLQMPPKNGPKLNIDE